MTNAVHQQYPGRYELLDVRLNKLDRKFNIKQMILEFDVYSSIIDTTNVLTVIVADAKNILSNIPIEGGDVIEIDVKYYDTSHTYSFVIAEISSINNLDRQRVYKLECISHLAFVSQYAKISRSYRGQTSEIAAAILQQYGTTEEINSINRTGAWDTSVGVQTLVIPNWSPIETLKFLARRSRAVTDNVRFRFFQNSRQGYHFMPIEKASDWYLEAPITYSYNLDTFQKNDTPNSKAAMESILSLEYHDSFNITTALRKGRIAARRYATDITNKRQDVLDWNYWQDFKNGRYLNRDPLWTSIADYGPGRIQYDTFQTDVDGLGDINKISDTSNLKGSALDTAQAITIVVKGNQTVDIGQVVNIRIPSPEPKTDQMINQLDLRWSGRYYVIAKRDMFNQNGKQTTLTLAKESIASNLT